MKSMKAVLSYRAHKSKCLAVARWRCISRLLSADIMKYMQTELLGFYALKYIINLFSYALPFNENEKMISFLRFKIYYSRFMSLPGTSKVQI